MARTGRGSLRGITLEIGGDTTKLNKALQEVNQDAKASQNALKEIDKALKFDPGNTELIAAKQRELQNELKATKEQLNILQEADKTAKKQLANGEIGIEDYAKLQSEIGYTTEKIKKLEAESSKVRQTLINVGQGMQNAGSKMTSVGSSLSKTVTPAVLALGVAGIKFAADAAAMESQFEQTFVNNLGDATKSIEELSTEVGALPNRIKPAFTAMAAFGNVAGMDAAESLELAERATRVAADSAAYYDKSLEDATESLQSFLKGNYANDAALGISATETTRNTKANELYGQSFNDLSEAQKQLTLLAMVEEGNELSGALGQAARESEQLTNQMGNLQQQSKDTLAQIAAPLIEPTIEVIKDLGDVLVDVAEWFTSLDPEMQKFIMKTLAISAAAGPVLSAAGTAVTTVGKLAEGLGRLNIDFSGLLGFLAGPVGVIAGIGLLVGTIAAAIAKTEGLSEEAKRLKDQFEAVDESFEKSKKEIEGNAYAADYLTDKIFELAAVEEKTTGQKAELTELTKQLNKLVPELGLEYDDLNDSLNMTESDVKAVTESLKDQAVFMAMSDHMSKYIETLGETAVALKESKNNIATVEEAYQGFNQAIENNRAEWEKLRSEGVSDDVIIQQIPGIRDAYAEWEDALVSVGETKQSTYTDMQYATTQYLDYEKDNQSDLQEIYDDSEKDLDDYSEVFADVQKKIADSSEEKTEDVKENLKEEVEAVEDQEEELKKIEEERLKRQEDRAKKEEDILNTKKESLQKFHDDIESRTFEHNKNLNAIDKTSQDENLTNADNWLASMQEKHQRQLEFNENIAKLSAALPQQMLEELRQYGIDEADLIADLAEKTPEQLQPWVDAWVSNHKLAGETAVKELQSELGLTDDILEALLDSVYSTGAGLPTYYKDGLESSASTAAQNTQTFVDSLILIIKDLEDTGAIGENMVQGIANGIDRATWKAIEAAARMSDSVITTTGQRLEIMSPSKVFERIGKLLPAGIAVGIDKDSYLAVDAANRMADDLAVNPKINAAVGFDKLTLGKPVGSLDNSKHSTIAVTNYIQSKEPLTEREVARLTKLELQKLAYLYQ